jgi:hypothetical protein
MNTASLSPIWANCVELLKDRVNNRSFWEALEKTVPVTIENGLLVIGMDASAYNLAGHIQHPAHMNVVTRVVQERFHQPLQVRVIEGTTLEDWQTTKVRDAAAAALKQSAPPPRPAFESVQADSWETLNEHLTRLYAQTPLRSLPQGKARFANEALYTLVEAMDTLYAEETSEATERHLARTLERIAANSDIPAPVLAFELERLRAWQRTGMESE